MGVPADVLPDHIPLIHYLGRYRAILDEKGVEEIMVNGPGEIFIERAGLGVERIEDNEVTYESLCNLAQLIASASGQSLNEVDTLLSASLPSGERVQLVLPPSCEPGKICISIRKPGEADLTLDALGEMGAFDHVKYATSGHSDDDKMLLELHKKKEVVAFLSLAVRAKKNIVISGGTSSGKTTLANAMLKNIPDHERIITIEDVREVQLAQSNCVHLLASKGGQGTAKAGIGDLFSACLRLRPDRIMLSEIRGKEAYDFLNSVTSGHPGSITTVHADNIRYAIERLARYVGDHDSGRNIIDREDYIKKSVDIIIQVNKTKQTGWRGITDIYFEPDEQGL